MILDQNHTHIMLDLETLGVGPNAPIVAIGAVNVLEPRYNFYTKVSPSGSPECGTVSWWLKQAINNPAAAREVISAIDSGVTERVACEGFRDWLSQPWVGNLAIWGNGAAFDEPRLSEMFAREGIKTPWSYRDSRCYRTIVAAFGDLVTLPEGSGTAHNALHDAEYQSAVLRTINTYLCHVI